MHLKQLNPPRGLEVRYPLTKAQADRFIKRLFIELDCKNCRQLGIKLGVSIPTISRIYNAKYGVSANMLIRLHDMTGKEIKEIKSWLNLPSGE